MSSRDYYDILGLTPDADGTTVNRTYWHLARKYQALAVSDPRAHHMLDELNEAYAVLGTSRLRDEYDALPRESGASAPPSGASNPPAGNTARPALRARTTGPAAPRPGAPKIAAGASSWVPYAAAGSIAVAAAIAGSLSGNVLLITLGASGGLALAIATTRHKISAAWLKLRASEEEEDGDAAPSLAPLKAQPATATAATLRPQRRQAPVDELRVSTASMVGRWRSSVARPEVPARQPDSTLVDIFQSEHDVETHAEPLSAVLDILRGDHHTVESR